jgi:hypothetical protein
LFEHKSFPYRFTALQLLKYMVGVWELHLKQFPGQILPTIIPLVIYHGIGPWRYGTSWGTSSVCSETWQTNTKVWSTWSCSSNTLSRAPAQELSYPV